MDSEASLEKRCAGLGVRAALSLRGGTWENIHLSWIPGMNVEKLLVPALHGSSFDCPMLSFCMIYSICEKGKWRLMWRSFALFGCKIKIRIPKCSTRWLALGSLKNDIQVTLFLSPLSEKEGVPMCWPCDWALQSPGTRWFLDLLFAKISDKTSRQSLGFPNLKASSMYLIVMERSEYNLKLPLFRWILCSR